MVKTITKDILMLQTKSTPATMDDNDIIKDLLDTAEQHRDRCCGLAAIQISRPKRIIVVLCGTIFIPMINPEIVEASTESYIISESCMSLAGERETTRHHTITVKYRNRFGKMVKMTCSGTVAQIIQHEIDHCNGILI